MEEFEADDATWKKKKEMGDFIIRICCTKYYIKWYKPSTCTTCRHWRNTENWRKVL